MTTLSSILAWRIPWTEEPGGLQSTGWQKKLDMREKLTVSLSIFLTFYFYQITLILGVSKALKYQI